MITYTPIFIVRKGQGLPLTGEKFYFSRGQGKERNFLKLSKIQLKIKLIRQIFGKFGIVFTESWMRITKMDMNFKLLQDSKEELSRKMEKFI